MVLVDTSVWVDYIRFGNARLAELLRHNQVLMHEMVLGEIACGSLRQRAARLEMLGNLPHMDMAAHAEVLVFIEKNRLFGCGVGYVHNHLLASVLLRPGARLWSSDKRLADAAHRLGIAFAANTH